MSDDFLASPPKKKKLPFKPTALRRAAASKPEPTAQDNDNDDDGLDLFRRAKEMAPIVAADHERRLKRKQKQRELDEQRRAARRMSYNAKQPTEDEQHDGPSPRDEPHSDDVEKQEADLAMTEVLDQPTTEMEEGRASELATPPPSKRSRHSVESSKKSSETIEEAAEEVTEPSPSAKRFLRSYRRPDSPVKQSPRKPSPAKQLSSQKEPFNPGNAPVILLDSDSEDEVTRAEAVPARRGSSSNDIEITGVSSPQPATSQAPQIEPVEDDEFAEYVRRAEEQHARSEALLRLASGGSLTKDTTEICVSSQIPDATTVVVKFTFDKPLRLVRETWLAIQQKKGVKIPTDNLEDVVLTWRHKKVYNYSTLLSLGIQSQGDGRLAADTFGLTGFNKLRTRVHMEVWTPELFQQMEHEEDLRRRREAGELSDEEDEASELDKSPEVKLKVILKARDLEDVKLTIRPETTVETLITGFRTQRDVATNKDVKLWFDGERLEEHMTMIDAEIDNMDTIEVHVK